MSDKKATPTFALDKEGKRIFNELVEYLEKAGELHQADLEAVTTCASIGSRVIKYQRIVAEKGETMIYANGNAGMTPEYKVLIQAEESFSRYLRTLGVTAQGRKQAGVRAKGKKAESATLSLVRRAK